ncbi:hypothetical protein PF005_g9232 [Phytophthora fragariae]|uniref:Phosphoglycerate mutase-like protein n=1 Tax=Phytophthora fragariae TaxID=53985 RepID=A0A6A3SHW1_9STRA|nr:hypothetical protein PF009_g10283 [Phytophthora fragariae]KAE9117032.1 hypothetical protein PF007_g9446 [Phytophthora fragariae]KAE9147090.1 hypothetical protein PF006_g8192 [Phytophthora fragariae]KAE9215972.1 hypothetical protein PF005_g9232 [Phytophthora fragariae]KAE9239846.1 hypothetical protein PF002_g10062 [Phytophthora fragariae]
MAALPRMAALPPPAPLQSAQWRGFSPRRRRSQTTRRSSSGSSSCLRPGTRSNGHFAQLEKPQGGSASVPRRLKAVYLVRHAEGTHNAADKQFGTERWESELAFSDKYLDADLTPFGVSDAQSKGPVSLKAELDKGMPPIERIVVSPLSRAIQTAQNFFAKDQAPAAPFKSMESCREILGCHTCDKRRSVSELKLKFPDVDFSAIKDEQDQLWTPTHRETDDEMQTRAKVFLLELFRDVQSGTWWLSRTRALWRPCARWFWASESTPRTARSSRWY